MPRKGGEHEKKEIKAQHESVIQRRLTAQEVPRDPDLQSVPVCPTMPEQHMYRPEIQTGADAETAGILPGCQETLHATARRGCRRALRASQGSSKVSARDRGKKGVPPRGRPERVAVLPALPTAHFGRASRHMERYETVGRKSRHCILLRI